jgi:hypothetical protein
MLGSIESITINGTDSFDETNQYYYNAPVVIVVILLRVKGAKILQEQNHKYCGLVKERLCVGTV